MVLLGVIFLELSMVAFVIWVIYFIFVRLDGDLRREGSGQSSRKEICGLPEQSAEVVAEGSIESPFP